jgi:cAMP-dependent protein kinase regulator
MSLPPTYTNELNTLNREILKSQPQDVLQFCANFFNRRLESQRAEFLLETKSGVHMAESNFPGSNPFGGGATSPGMQQLKEEDEMEPTTSPTASNYGQSPFSKGGHGQPKNPFSAGDDTASPFGSSYSPGSQPPSAFKPIQQPKEGFPNNYAMGRRTSVSAESLNPQSSMDDNWKPPYHPKSADQLARLRTAVAGNFLFSHLDDDQSSQVLGALVEKPIPAKGIKVITQGDAGDYFYIVEKGNFDIHINETGSVQPGPDGIGRKVTTIGPGGSFGELALMYNAARAATVISTEPDSLLWYLDRVTFRRILMDSAFARRRMYESFLNEVPLLSGLAPYERSKIADALETQKFPADSTIIKEGDPGEAFFLLESGTCAVYKRESGNKVLMKYKKGDYFGELALLDDKPRAASVVSTSEVKVATLGKEGFLRLLGPVEGRMRQNDPSKRGPDVQELSQTGVEGVDPLSK